MNRDEIKTILPHRDSMLLLDQLDREGEIAHGQYRVKGDEWFLQGHFPDAPVVPGVILCEILAQSAGILMQDSLTEDTIPMYTSMKNVRFRAPVLPGDLFETKCRITRAKHPFYFAEGEGYVGDTLCVKAEFSFGIANRGEIAVRIIRACKEMGIATVAIYSQADRDALHVALADESYCVGGASPGESYLNEERVVSAALVSGAQAIHPGYGFLSENAHFAALCRKNGLVFIGPSPESMEELSDKARLKEIMGRNGLEVIPGTQVLASAQAALAAAAEIGYPVMLKASAGGGGRGIRLVSAPNEMTQAYALAVAEGEASFGDGSVYMEKYVHPARHIEVQVLADEAGNVVCLGERDCSVQRHHQKLIEESPSPAVSRSQRKKLMELTARAVKAIGYVGVGTLEFLLDRDGRFWFMEMNLRLQVEHGVTEMLTQVDLVKWQIRTAAGVPLNFQQQNVALNGACVECRINALTPGTLSMLHVPGGPFVRFDTYLVSGISVSPYYDALLGKLIVYAGTREEAMRKMKAALCELVVEGIETNIAEQLELVSDPRFMTGQYDLTFMEGR